MNNPMMAGSMMAVVEEQATHDPLAITGYRKLSPAEIEKMNTIKAMAASIGILVEDMLLDPKCDTRWVAVAKTQLQQGFMALTRAVAQPTSF